jgi:hypothetical protein
MAPAGHQLMNLQQALGFQLFQSAEHIVAPLFVPPVAASAWHLKAAVQPSEPPQQFVFTCATECQAAGL